MELNPRPAQGGGRCAPPLKFCRSTPNHESGRTEISHSLWGIFCATFGEKKIGRVMSGHGAITSQEVQGQAIFLREMADYSTLEDDIDHNEASSECFRSELTCVTPPQYPLTFWSRSGQIQGQGQVNDLGWPYDKFMCCLLMSWRVSGGPEFVSAIHLRHSRFISTAVQAAATFRSR